MNPELEFLGTANARRVPVYGCPCRACERARQQPVHARRACSALLEVDGFRLMLDAGRTDLCETFAPGSIQAVLLTHYHMDHVMGLFHLRWGINQRLPVYGPEDDKGCDDLYRHPGILDFQPPLTALESTHIGPFQVTPLPLIHSKPVLGYGIEYWGKCLAYLTDTVGLPDSTLAWLRKRKPDLMVLDCSTPPKAEPPRNHNDLSLALTIARDVGAGETWLTHIGHQLDEYWLDHPHLPDGVRIARDGLRVGL